VTNGRFQSVTPQKFDSVVRTATAALLALTLVAAVTYIAIAGHPGDRLSAAQAVLVGWAGIVVGFYFGGHVAQNTAAVEEARQIAATAASEASAVRSEASATRREADNE